MTVIEISTVDYHTAGEPFRIVVGGAPPIPGATVAERRVAAPTRPEVEAVRRLLCLEPRGHADMYGCFPVPPDPSPHPPAHLGAVFWHKDGYSTACGHGTIALGVWAVDSGRVAAPRDGVAEVAVDVPSGRVAARVAMSGGRPGEVTFRSVPAYPLARGVPVATPIGPVRVDLGYGGAIYACLPAAALGLAVAPERLAELIAAARMIKAGLAGSPAARHPVDDRLSGIYGVIFYEELADEPDALCQRNVTVFADGEVDRSPCGSGTAARLALLHEEGRLDSGRVLRHRSVIGTAFSARIAGTVRDGGREAIVPEITGTAYRTGEHRFVADPRDPLASGFVLR